MHAGLFWELFAFAYRFWRSRIFLSLSGSWQHDDPTYSTDIPEITVLGVGEIMQNTGHFIGKKMLPETVGLLH
jgi:hypothetical protein